MHLTRNSLNIIIVCMTTALLCIITTVLLTFEEEPINCFCGGERPLSLQQYDAYDNTVTTGTQVLNAIRKFNNKGSFGIQVITDKKTLVVGQTSSWFGNVMNTSKGPGTETYGRVKEIGSEILEKVNDASIIEYVDPKAAFKSSVVRDNNNDVRGIIFREQ